MEKENTEENKMGRPHLIVLVALLVAGIISLVYTTELNSVDNKAQTPYLGNPYLAGWRKSGPGGGGFTMDIRVAPQNFFKKSKDGIVYLAEDMHGVFRSRKINPKNGEVSSWEHLWYPTQGVAEEMPTKFATSLAFTNGIGAKNQGLVVGTRDGIFIYRENTRKWERPTAMPERKDFEAKGMTMETVEGKYPWIGVVREVPEKSEYLLAGIGDSRESYVIGNRRFGLNAIYRSRDGGLTWDIVQLKGVDAKEVVFDIKYMVESGNIHTFVSTDRAIYHSKNVFSNNEPAFSIISNGIHVNATNNTKPKKEIRSVEVVKSATGSNLGIFVTLYSQVLDMGGIYQTILPAENLGKDDLSIAWSRMKGNESVFKSVGKLLKTKESTLESYKIYVSKFNVPFLAVTTNELASWKAIVQGKISNADSAYEEEWDRSVFGSFEIVPDYLFKSKEPTIYGAWRFGPIFTPGHTDNAGLARKFYQMFSTFHHEYLGEKFFVTRGFDEGGFLGSIPEFKPDTPGTIVLAAPDNGIMVSQDFGQSWSSNPPKLRADWVKDYGTRLITGYQARYNPLDSSCVFVSAGPNRFGDGVKNVGEIVVNTHGAFGPTSSWSTFAGGKNNLLGLPNAEIHTMVFDLRVSETGNAGLILGVRGHGIYYGEITPTCMLKEGTVFEKINSPLLNTKISELPGLQHYYSSIELDPYNKDVIYVGRAYPAGGVFALNLGFDSVTNTRLGLSNTNFLTKVTEIIRGAGDVSAKRRCPLDTANNYLNAIEINGIAVSKDYVFAGVGYGKFEDIQSTNIQCKPKGLSGHVNYYGGIIRMKKSDFANQASSSYKNTWLAGGPEDVSSLPMKVFQVGAIAVNPIRRNEVVAMTTGSVFPKNRAKDQILAGEDDSKISGIFTSQDEGASFIFTPWATSFPNALSMRFSKNGRALYVATRGNGIHVWVDLR